MTFFSRYLGKPQKPREIFAKTFFSFRTLDFSLKIGNSSREDLFPLFFFFFEIAWKNFWGNFFFWRTLALCALAFGLGIENFCPWTQKGLFLRSRFLAEALTSDFFRPWLRRLCSRLHICLVQTYTYEKRKLKISQPLRSHMAFSLNCFYRARWVSVFLH